MTDVRVDVELGALPQAMVDNPGYLVGQAKVAAIDAAGPYLQRKLYDRTPTGATALLRQHTTYERGSFMGEPQGFVGPVGAPSLYALFAEEGRRPGAMPPKEPIAYWVRRVLQVSGPEADRVTYLVRRKIARRGTKGHHYIAETVRVHGDRARLLMRRAAAAAIRMATGQGAA